MEATELMAGNYLSYNGQIIKVENITNKKVGYHVKDNECRMHYARLHECKPIPLEKVHLTKNGFKAREETYGIEFYYYDRYVIKVDFYKGLPEDNMPPVIPPVIFLIIKFAEKDMAMPIEYVHELQQAMRLYGIEKEIIL